MALAVGLAVVWIGLLSVFLPILGEDWGKQLGVLLLDNKSNFYPFTIQNTMWVVFFIGLGELWLRLHAAQGEHDANTKRYLPEDELTVLTAQALNKVYEKVKTAEQQNIFLPKLIKRLILQFHSSRSTAQVNDLLNASIELYLHEIELRYSLLRYIAWLIPTLGFIGTVLGIALGLGYAGQAGNDPNLLTEVTTRLAVAFNTTLVALILSAILMFLIHLVQEREEKALNKSSNYCIDNFVVRLYIERDKT